MHALKLAPLAALAVLTAVPALADHRHRRDCGHVYSRPHGGWVSIDVFGRFGGFSYQSRRSPYSGRYRGDRYADPYGYSRGYRGYSKKELKRMEKYYKKRYRKSRHYGHHDYGPFCPRY